MESAGAATARPPSHGHPPSDRFVDGPNDGEDGAMGEEWSPDINPSSPTDDVTHSSSGGVRSQRVASRAPEGVRWSRGWVPGIFARALPGCRSNVSLLVSCLTGRALEWANAVWNGPDSGRGFATNWISIGTEPTHSLYPGLVRSLGEANSKQLQSINSGCEEFNH